MNTYFEIFKKISGLDLVNISAHVTFDEDGSIFIEWIGKSCRVGATFSPEEKESAWHFVSKDPMVLDGPNKNFDNRFFECLVKLNESET